MSSPDIRVLHLARLKEGFPGVSFARALNFFEACLVCFHLQKQASGLKLIVKGDFEAEFIITWTETVDETIIRSWDDPEEATEAAACGIAFLLVIALTDYTIIQRSRKGTGFDYWLGLKDALVFEAKARLEISGIFKARRESEIVERVKNKKEQTALSDKSELPAYIVVVEFSHPLAYLVKK